MKKIATWEKELWHYVNNGDQLRCPQFKNYHSSARFNYYRCSNCKDHPCCSQCSDPVKSGQPPLFVDAEDRAPCRNAGARFIEVIRPGRVNELIELLAQSWLKKGKVRKPPVPADLVNLFDKSCEINIRVLPLKACHGALWRTSRSWEIYLNANDSPAEQRVTLFHEGFHIMAHLKANPVFKKPGNPEGSYNEYLADCFAYKLLMPQKWVERDWAEYQNHAALTKIFQVPRKAVSLRLRELNLIQ